MSTVISALLIHIPGIYVIYRVVVLDVISKVSIYRNIELSICDIDVFCLPSPGIPVIFMLILNESFHVRTGSKYRNRIIPIRFFCYRYRIELDSDTISISNINAECCCCVLPYVLLLLLLLLFVIVHLPPEVVLETNSSYCQYFLIANASTVVPVSYTHLTLPTICSV